MLKKTVDKIYVSMSDLPSSAVFKPDQKKVPVSADYHFPFLNTKENPSISFRIIFEEAPTDPLINLVFQPLIVGKTNGKTAYAAATNHTRSPAMDSYRLKKLDLEKLVDTWTAP